MAGLYSPTGSAGAGMPPAESSQGQSWVEQAGRDAYSWISGAWKGKDPIRTCPGEWSPAAVYQVLQRATDDELRAFESWIAKGGMADGYKGPVRAANPQVLAHGLAGGDDCDFDWSETIQANARMNDLVMRYANGATGSGNVQTTETYYPPPIRTTGSGAPTTSQQVQQAGSSVWDGIKDFFSGIFRGAATGAASAAQAGGTASQVTSQTTVLNLIIPILFLGFLVWFVRRK